MPVIRAPWMWRKAERITGISGRSSTSPHSRERRLLRPATLTAEPFANEERHEEREPERQIAPVGSDRAHGNPNCQRPS